MQLKEHYNRSNKNIPFLDGLHVKNQYTLFSEVGNMPARKPPPAISRKSCLYPCLVGYSANPLADKRPENDGSFRPRYFATTEYIPSHPTNTCTSTKACSICQMHVMVSVLKAFHVLVLWFSFAYINSTALVDRGPCRIVILDPLLFS
jgi:hypothetical protein